MNKKLPEKKESLSPRVRRMLLPRVRGEKLKMLLGAKSIGAATIALAGDRQREESNQELSDPDYELKE